MSEVICPYCQSVTPPFQYCIACNAFLGNLLDEARPGPAEKHSSTGGLLERVWSWLKELFGSAGNGREIAPLDPYIRRDCWRSQKRRIAKLASSSSAEDEIALIAKVDDIDAFKSLVRGEVITIVDRSANDPTSIVTTRVAGDELAIDALRRNPFVKSLKAARRMRPFLERSVAATLGERGEPGEDAIAQTAAFNGGRQRVKPKRDVIVGVIDFGLDFVHRNFRDRNGRTRILALWDQKGRSGTQSP